MKVVNRLKNLFFFVAAPQLSLPCLYYLSGTPSDGYDSECEYEEGWIGCDDCVCSDFGLLDPRTGKEIRLIAKWIKKRRIRKLCWEKWGRSNGLK